MVNGDSPDIEVSEPRQTRDEDENGDVVAQAEAPETLEFQTRGVGEAEDPGMAPGLIIEDLDSGERRVAETAAGKQVDVAIGEGQTAQQALDEQQRQEAERERQQQQQQDQVARQSLEEFARAQGVAPPETREQREILQTVRQVRRFEETGGGFSREERDIIGGGGEEDATGAQVGIEQAEAVDQIERDLQTLEQSIETVETAPETATFTLGQETGLSRGETLTRLEDTREQLRSSGFDIEFNRAIGNLTEAQQAAAVTARQERSTEAFGEPVGDVLSDELLTDQLIGSATEAAEQAAGAAQQAGLPVDETIQALDLEDELVGAQLTARGFGRSGELFLRGAGTELGLSTRRLNPDLAETLTGETQQEAEQAALQQARRTQLQAAQTTPILTEGVLQLLPEPTQPDRELPDNIFEAELQTITEPAFLAETIAEEVVAEPVTIGATVPTIPTVLRDTAEFEEQFIGGAPLFVSGFTGRELRQEALGELINPGALVAVPSVEAPSAFQPRVQEEVVTFEDFEGLREQSGFTPPQAGEAVVRRRVASPITERLPDVLTQERITESVEESLGGGQVPAGFVQRTQTVEQVFGVPEVRLPRRESAGLRVRRGELGGQRQIGLEPPQPEFVSEPEFEPVFDTQADVDAATRLEVDLGVGSRATVVPRQVQEPALGVGDRLFEEQFIGEEVQPAVETPETLQLTLQQQQSSQEILQSQQLDEQIQREQARQFDNVFVGRFEGPQRRVTDDLFEETDVPDQDTQATASLIGLFEGIEETETPEEFTGLGVRGFFPDEQNRSRRTEQDLQDLL